MTTADLFELDDMVVLLNDKLPCPRNVRLRTGFYALITFSLGHARTVTPWESWIKNNNRALAPRWPCIAVDYAAAMQELHP
jgi:hypothetical protein